MNEILKKIIDRDLDSIFSARELGIKKGRENAEELDMYIREKTQELMEHYSQMSATEIIAESLISQLRSIEGGTQHGEE